MASLSKFILDRVKRKRQHIQGHAVNTPYLATVGTQQVWVVDVLINSKSELLKQVAIPENNRQIRNFISANVPLEIQKSSAGQFFVSGLSNIHKGDVKLIAYNIQDSGLAFTQGFKFNGSGQLITGNGNPVTLGPDTEQTFSYETTIIPYGDLDYGTTPYGATKTERV